MSDDPCKVATDLSANTEDGLPPKQEPVRETEKVSAQELIKKVNEQLKAQVPDTPQFTFPEENLESKEAMVNKANSEAINILGRAKLAVINAYSNNEIERTKRQKPLLYIVIVLTALQLIAFNAIVGGIVFLSFKNGDSAVLGQMFNILKYYIGATVAELIGMIFFITKGTFSSNHIKTMEHLLKDTQNDPDKK